MANTDKKLLVGNKNHFAVEISSKESDFKIGKIHFWINGVCLGKEEDTYIKPNLLAMERINDLSSHRVLDINLNSIDGVFNKILKNKQLYTQTLLGFGETFDDYVLRPFIFDSNVIFLWIILSIQREIKSNFSNVHCGIVKCDEFYNVLAECNIMLPD